MLEVAKNDILKDTTTEVSDDDTIFSEDQSDISTSELKQELDFADNHFIHSNYYIPSTKKVAIPKITAHKEYKSVPPYFLSEYKSVLPETLSE